MRRGAEGLDGSRCCELLKGRCREAAAIGEREKKRGINKVVYGSKVLKVETLEGRIAISDSREVK